MASMSKRMRTWILVGLAIAGMLFLALGQAWLRMQHTFADGQPSGISSERAEIVAVTFSSRWCGPCKILKPRLAAIKPAFSDQPIRFIELNFSFGEQESYQAIAEQEGFVQAYDRFRKATGFTVLVDRDSGDVIDILTIDRSESAMQIAIEDALARVS